MNDSAPMESEEVDCALAPALSTPLQILIVEDDHNMALWVTKHLDPLKEAFPRASIAVVHTWADAEKVIAADPPPNVALLDLSLPDSKMVETINRVPMIEERCAVVIITGHNKDDVEKLLVDKKVEVLEKKPSLFGTGTIIRAIVRAWERKALQDEVQLFKGARSIVYELKSRGYGTPENSP